jgi:hypothetical protein
MHRLTGARFFHSLGKRHPPFDGTGRAPLGTVPSAGTDPPSETDPNRRDAETAEG